MSGIGFGEIAGAVANGLSAVKSLVSTVGSFLPTSTIPSMTPKLNGNLTLDIDKYCFHPMTLIALLALEQGRKLQFQDCDVTFSADRFQSLQRFANGAKREDLIELPFLENIQTALLWYQPWKKENGYAKALFAKAKSGLQSLLDKVYVITESETHSSNETVRDRIISAIKSIETALSKEATVESTPKELLEHHEVIKGLWDKDKINSLLQQLGIKEKFLDEKERKENSREQEKKRQASKNNGSTNTVSTTTATTKNSSGNGENETKIINEQSGEVAQSVDVIQTVVQKLSQDVACEMSRITSFLAKEILLFRDVQMKNYTSAKVKKVSIEKYGQDPFATFIGLVLLASPKVCEGTKIGFSNYQLDVYDPHIAQGTQRRGKASRADILEILPVQIAQFLNIYKPKGKSHLRVLSHLAILGLDKLKKAYSSNNSSEALIRQKIEEMKKTILNALETDLTLEDNYFRECVRKLWEDSEITTICVLCGIQVESADEKERKENHSKEIIIKPEKIDASTIASVRPMLEKKLTLFIPIVQRVVKNALSFKKLDWQ